MDNQTSIRQTILDSAARGVRIARERLRQLEGIGAEAEHVDVAKAELANRERKLESIIRGYEGSGRIDAITVPNPAEAEHLELRAAQQHYGEAI